MGEELNGNKVVQEKKRCADNPLVRFSDVAAKIVAIMVVGIVWLTVIGILFIAGAFGFGAVIILVLLGIPIFGGAILVVFVSGLVSCTRSILK